MEFFQIKLLTIGFETIQFIEIKMALGGVPFVSITRRAISPLYAVECTVNATASRWLDLQILYLIIKHQYPFGGIYLTLFA